MIGKAGALLRDTHVRRIWKNMYHQELPGHIFPECMTEAKQTQTPHQPGNAGRWGVWQSERHAFISWESA